MFAIEPLHAQAFGGNPYRQLLPLCGSVLSYSSGSCMRSLETPRDDVRIRRSGQILRFTFHGCVDDGFVDGCEPFCGGQQKVCISWRTCVVLAIRPQVLYWQYRSACMATGIFVSTSFGRPFYTVEFTQTLPLSHLGFCGQFDFVCVPVDFKHCSSNRFAFINLLNLDQNRAEPFRISFFQYARTCMPGCQGLSMQLNVPAQSLTREEEIDRRKVPAPNTAPQAVCVWESILVMRYGQDDHHLAASYTESLTLRRRTFLFGSIQHDMIALCEPVIILCGLIPVTLAAWSLSFSSAACTILVEWIIVLLMEQQVVTHHSVLFRLNGWLFC